MAGFIVIELRPLIAQRWLCALSVGKDSVVQSARDAINVKEATGGDDLALCGVFILALYLAEIRCLARSEQGLRPGVAVREEQLECQVTATGRTLRVVTGTTWRINARIVRL
jgi:hypothetical protein